MVTADNIQEEFEANKVQVLQLAKLDGKLVSPIDLSLESAKPLQLDSLRWANLNNPPVKMKLTNTGNTAVLTGKWTSNRPYIFGGPVENNYVFSQIHFHWGSDEHEGSEHKVKGICYPMEMHIVFFKAQYLSQEAALKHDDGIILVVYLVKLLEKTTPSLRLLASYLENVVQPRTSVRLPLLPLSSLLVPFTRDYLLYWGALYSQTKCSHTVLWIISRAALGVTVEDLKTFRNLLNSENEHMNRNFRKTSPAMGRNVFHVNPSNQREHLLLRGTVDPLGSAVIVNFSQLPGLDPAKANEILGIGDSTRDEKEKSVDSSSVKGMKRSERNEVKGSKTLILCENVSNNDSADYENSTSPPSSYRTYTSSRVGSTYRQKKYREVNRTKSETRNKVIKRKKIEQERKLGPGKIKTKLSINSKSSQEVIRKFKKPSKDKSKQTPSKKNLSDLKIGEKLEKEENKNEDLCGFCVHVSDRGSSKNDVVDQTKEQALENMTPKNKPDDKTVDYSTNNINTAEKEKNIRSRLPTPIKINKEGLKSSLACYFSKPGSERNHNTSKPMTPNLTHDLTEGKTFRKQMTTSIPRPLGKNAGKFPAGSLENELFEGNLQTVRPIIKRPLSSPVKPLQQTSP